LLCLGALLSRHVPFLGEPGHETNGSLIVGLAGLAFCNCRLSSEEKEVEMMRAMPKFKALPLNEKIFERCVMQCLA
jgi:hypothetical protein